MSEFTHYLQDVFRDIQPITTRRMFGGYGIFKDGLMFALVADDTLYLKVDAINQVDFQQRSLPAFQYSKGDKTFSMSYHLAPDEIFDQPALAAAWAERSIQAAHRSHASKPKRRRK